MSCQKGGGFDWNKDCTTLLIHLYEEHPCLYLVTEKSFHNRNKRIEALEKITAEFNKRKLTNLTLEDIKKKIRGIRTQYLAEVNKIKKSEVSGASTDDVYTPKLWCFDYLQFLQQGSGVVTEGESNIMESTASEREGVSEESESEFSSEVVFDGEIGDIERVVLPPHSRGINIEQFHTPSTSKSDNEQLCRKRKRRMIPEKEKISGFLDTALTTLQNLTDEPKHEQHVLKHGSFGQFIIDEMEKIEDEILLDELKENIVQHIFSTKRRQRDLSK